MFGNVALVVLIALASCAFGYPEDDLFNAMSSKCMHKAELENGFGQQANKNDSGRNCFSACILKSHGLLMDDGRFDIEKAVADLSLEIPDRERVTAAIKKCGKKTGEDECITAHLVKRCLVHEFAFVLPGQTKHYLVQRKCLDENDIKPENFRRIPRSDERKKCYYACVLKGGNLLKEDGTYDVEKAIADLPSDMPNRDRVVAAVIECGNKTGANDCETAYLFQTCIVDRLYPRRAKFEIIFTKCLEKNDIQPEKFRDIPWNDERKKCFRACIMKERGHLKKDGTYDVEKAIEDLPQSLTHRNEIIKSLYKCSTIKNDNECQTAFLISSCLRAQNSFSVWRHGYHDHSENGL